MSRKVQRRRFLIESLVFDGSYSNTPRLSVSLSGLWLVQLRMLNILLHLRINSDNRCDRTKGMQLEYYNWYSVI